MKTVWKFKLEPQTELDLPKNAEILSVHAIGDEVYLWVLVDSNAETEKRKFMSFGTGHEIPEQNMNYIGSAFLYQGALVFHVFEFLE